MWFLSKYFEKQQKLSNYRSISLISNIDKILERIVYNHSNKFSENNKLIYNLQFGFRQKHSTSHALIHLAGRIREQLDNGKYGCRIFINFQKAFDTVDHAIFTQKLNYYSFRGDANNCFFGFNSDFKELTVVSSKGQY